MQDMGGQHGTCQDTTSLNGNIRITRSRYYGVSSCLPDCHVLCRDVTWTWAFLGHLINTADCLPSVLDPLVAQHT